MRWPPRGRGSSRRLFFGSPLAALPAVDVDLADLKRLLTHPARGFLRQRLQVAETRGEDEPADALPVELDNLEQWAVGDRVLHERLNGLDVEACKALELHRGTLPPGPLGMTTLSEIGPRVEALLASSTIERELPPESHDVDAVLADGTRLTGTVGGVRGDTVLSLTYSRLAARHRLEAWIDLVALTATRPEVPWCATAVGRGRRGVSAQRSVFDPLSAVEARAALEDLVWLYRAGLRSPLPMPLKTAAAYAERRNHSDTPTAREGAEQRVAHRPVSRRAGGRRARAAVRTAPRAARADLPAAGARRGRHRLARRRDRPVRPAGPAAVGPVAGRRGHGADVTGRRTCSAAHCGVGSATGGDAGPGAGPASRRREVAVAWLGASRT